jgi:hypothetical protein
MSTIVSRVSSTFSITAFATALAAISASTTERPAAAQNATPAPAPAGHCVRRAPEAGYRWFSVLDASAINATDSRVRVSHGSSSDVFPGQAGYLATCDGAKVSGSDFAVASTGTSSSMMVLKGIPLGRITSGSWIAVKNDRQCRARKTPKTAPKVATFERVNDDVEITLDQGFFQNIVPGTWVNMMAVVNNVPRPLYAKVVVVTANTATFKVEKKSAPMTAGAISGLNVARTGCD